MAAVFIVSLICLIPIVLALTEVFLLTKCEHEYKEIERYNVRTRFQSGFEGITGTEIVFMCDKCKKVKKTTWRVYK